MKRTYSAVYIINIVFQSIFTLLMYIGGSLLVSWLLVEKLSAPSLVYPIIILLGVMSGLVSMIRFILSAMRALDSLEKVKMEKRRNNEHNKKE